MVYYKLQYIGMDFPSRIIRKQLKAKTTKIANEIGSNNLIKIK